MMENVVSRMFRSATRSSQRHQSPVKMDDKGSSPGEEIEELDIAQIEIDNSAGVLQNLRTLHSEKLLSDLCLVVGNKEYHTHRLLLCASSEVFRVMLMNPQWSESQESRIALGETPACCEVFDRFLEYFYTGRICINSQIVMPILTLADKYNIKDLAQICQDYMHQHIPYAAANNQLVAWHHYTLMCGHSEVAKRCQDFIKWNLELIAKTADFGNFEPDILVKILKQDDLIVHDEMTLFEYVVCWLNHQRVAFLAEAGYILDDDDDDDDGCEVIDRETEREVTAQIEELICLVMTHIRFPMMSPHQLAGLLIQPIVQQHKEFFIQRMAIGMSYHSGLYHQNDRVEAVCVHDEAGISLFTPRLYTAENWSMLLPVDNYTSLPAYHSRTHVFSSHAALADHKGDKTCEWVVDIYPKGVWFRKFFLIVWQGMEEVPEVVLRTVRVSITCKEVPSEGDMRVKVGILVWGIVDGVEHVMRTLVTIHRFNSENKVLNLDDVVSFDELNQDLANLVHESSSPLLPSSSSSTSSGTLAPPPPSPYLVGSNRDVLKIHVVIAPMDQVCSPALLLTRTSDKHKKSYIM